LFVSVVNKNNAVNHLQVLLRKEKRKMPKKFVFSVNNAQQFEGKLYTGRCSGLTKGGSRCKRNCIIIGFEYCFLHLKKEQQLKIKDSTIPQADEGLFAIDKSEPANETIFRAGDTISKYNS
jgi:hypothetical protein